MIRKDVFRESLERVIMKKMLRIGIRLKPPLTSFPALCGNTLIGGFTSYFK